MVRAMPDQSGVLSAEDKQKALQWLNSKWTYTPCPFHPATPTTWEIGDVVIRTLPFSEAGVVLGGSTYPLLVVTCSVCGYSVLVNAIKAGIVTAAANPPTPQVTPEPNK